MRKLKQWLLDNNDLDVSKVSLWKIIRTLGYTFRKSSSGRNLLCEKSHNIALRSKYLRELKQVRADGYEVFFLDETYIHAHHVFEKEWQNLDGTGVRIRYGSI